MRSAQLLLLVLLCSCVTSPRNVRGQPASEDWSLSASIDLPPRLVVTMPQVIAANGVTYVVANTLPAGTNAEGPRAVVWSSEIGLLPLPKGDFFFAHPSAAIDSDGALHLVWAEPPAGLEIPRHLPMLRASSLWSARFNRGAWTPAERIHESSSLQWASSFRSLGVDSVGTLSIFATTAVSDTGFGLVMIRGRTGRWRSDLLVARGFVSAVTSHGGGYFGATSRLGDPGTIVLIHVGPSGQIVRSSAVNADTASVTNMAVAVSGQSLWATWTTSRSNPRIYVAHSPDDGRTWRAMPAPHSVPPGQRLIRVSLAAGRCGALMIREFGLPGSTILETQLRDTVEVTRQVLTAALWPRRTGLVADGDKYVLTYTAQSAQGDVAPRIARRPTCAKQTSVKREMGGNHASPPDPSVGP